MEFTITKNDKISTYSEIEIKRFLGEKVSPNFLKLVERLKVNEELYYYETKMKIRRIK